MRSTGRKRCQILAGVLLALSLLTSPVGAREALTGRQLFELCSDGQAAVWISPACDRYFQEVLDALQSMTPPLPICDTKHRSIAALVTLYVSESKVYPNVLHVPAEQLITGMMLKFFACRTA
ncbi:MAG: hypothetical protein HOI95_18220 [Chromatiales bacterium]|jgi:hypothetical protein|nr:hypothetical protein [Chromatiales bacterium]